MARVSATSLYSLLLISSLLLVSQTHVSSERVARPPITAKGLSWNYYSLIECPKLERIIRKHLEDVFAKDSGVAPGILRIFFHDCFSQGCDASILLNATEGGQDEKHNFANFGLRGESLQVIEDLRVLIYKQCLPVVSCSDILVLAAREAVRQLGGPDFDVPLGRKDSKDFDFDSADNLPPPTFKTDDLLETFAERNINAEEMVALSGAHTFGRAHCATFFNRIEDPEPPIDADLRNKMIATCPNIEAFNAIDLDARSPNTFDNLYYINLLRNQGVFTSDQDLASHDVTKGIVEKFASDQKAFFNKFADAFVKVSQINVITDRQRKGEGEIRDKCYKPNKKRVSKTPVVEQVVELAQEI